MTRSSEELERDVEHQRGQVEQTLASLRERMSVGQLVDEAGHYVSFDDLGDAFRNAGRQARDNPLALGLVGAGVAWLMLGNGVRKGDSSRGFYHQTHLADGDAALADGDTTGPGERRAPDGRSTVGKAASAVSGAVRSTTESLRSAYDSGRRGMHDMRDRASEGGSTAYDAGQRYGGRVSESGASAYHAGRRYSGRMRHRVSDALENEPLIVGACALAFGVALGAVLPSTRTEDRWLGEERDEFMHRAKDAALHTKDQAVDAAKDTYETAKKAASDEGLTRHEGDATIAEKVENVAKKTADEAKRQTNAAQRHDDEADKAKKAGASQTASAKAGSTQPASPQSRSSTRPGSTPS